MIASKFSIGAQLDQLQQLTASPKIAQNPVAKFIATPNKVSFHVPDTTGVKSVDLLSSSFADPGTASIAQTWQAPSTPTSFSHIPATSSSSGKLHFWIRLNPQGTSGTAKMIGPQSVALGN